MSSFQCYTPACDKKRSVKIYFNAMLRKLWISKAQHSLLNNSDVSLKSLRRRLTYIL